MDLRKGFFGKVHNADAPSKKIINFITNNFHNQAVVNSILYNDTCANDASDLIKSLSDLNKLVEKAIGDEDWMLLNSVGFGFEPSKTNEITRVKLNKTPLEYYPFYKHIELIRTAIGMLSA